MKIFSDCAGLSLACRDVKGVPGDRRLTRSAGWIWPIDKHIAKARRNWITTAKGHCISELCKPTLNYLTASQPPAKGKINTSSAHSFAPYTKDSDMPLNRTFPTPTKTSPMKYSLKAVNLCECYSAPTWPIGRDVPGLRREVTGAAANGSRVKGAAKSVEKKKKNLKFK